MANSKPLSAKSLIIPALITYFCPYCRREVEVPPFARYSVVTVECKEGHVATRCIPSLMEPDPPRLLEPRDDKS